MHMGVDARMFAKLRGRENWLKDEDELATAVRMAQIIGHEHFMITRNSEYAFDRPHHALSIVRPLKDADDCAYHGLDASFVGRTVYTQDGPDIIAAEDEQFIEVHFYGRYYSEEYARGDFPVIRATAEWLEHRFQGCEVWYGGDSSGACAELFDRARRDRMAAYYLNHGGEEYFRRSSWDFAKLGAEKCPCCEIAMNGCGGGRDITFFECDGCGKKLVKHKSVELEWLKRHVSFSDRPSAQKTATPAA